MLGMGCVGGESVESFLYFSNILSLRVAAVPFLRNPYFRPMEKYAAQFQEKVRPMKRVDNSDPKKQINHFPGNVCSASFDKNVST